VLINLLDNAIKFTQSGSVMLRVNLLESPPEASGSVAIPSKVFLKFAVEDTGCGIAPADQDLIFAPFSQATVGDRPLEGTGLGLSISQKFVQLMGGELQLSSELHQGTTFSFTIPVDVPHSPTLDPGELDLCTIALAPNQPRPRILVVEDDWDNRLLMVSWLSQWGFIVCTAENGQEALQLWQQEPPDLIFMDLRMPVMDGQTAIRQIRQIEQERQQSAPATDLSSPAKIVVITAGVLPEHPDPIAALGCDDFLGKPFCERDLCQVLVKHLGGQCLYATPGRDYPQSLRWEATPAILTAAAFQALPDTWVADFHWSLNRLDQDRMLALAADLGSKHGDLAAALSQAIHNFEYERLLTLIEDIL
jgi:CheY-like chemotaxis protein